MGFRVLGLGFRVWGLEFRVSGLGFGVSGLGFPVWGLGLLGLPGFTEFEGLTEFIGRMVPRLFAFYGLRVQGSYRLKAFKFGGLCTLEDA